MNILALDFSSPQRSVAVVSGSEGGALRRSQTESGIRQGLAETAPPNRDAVADLSPPNPARVVSEIIEAGRGNTMKALRMVEEALKQARLEREQIDCLAIGLGPGSYTGIRAAIALAQGWQLASRHDAMRLLGINSADCVAAQAHADGIRGRLNVVIDAQREEFYFASYDLNADAWREGEPLRLATKAEVGEQERLGGMMIGPGATCCSPRGRLVFPRAATLGRLALGRNDFVAGEKLEPIYLREVTFVKAAVRPAGRP
jgi:tRNA threonylcarbamoyl adenosine modification protein YeaZ